MLHIFKCQIFFNLFSYRTSYPSKSKEKCTIETLKCTIFWVEFTFKQKFLFYELSSKIDNVPVCFKSFSSSIDATMVFILDNGILAKNSNISQTIQCLSINVIVESY